MQDCYVYAEERLDKGTTALSLACCGKLSLPEHEWTASELPLLIHGRMVQQLIQPGLVMVLKDVSSLQILSPPTTVPGNRATLAHVIQNPSWGRLWANQVNTVGWHHPWASQPVQLKKHLWYQGSRHHLWPVAYAQNYPLHQLSGEVLPALHSHTKDAVHSFSSCTGYLTALAQ